MTNTQYRFGEFCRVCLRQNIDLIYLKSEDNDLITYFEKLQIINNGSITESDIFPNWICTKCKNHLCFCYKFFQKCQKAVTVLTECLKQIKKANGNNTTKFYITNIKDVETSTVIEDPLIIKDEEWNVEEENKNCDVQFSIKIKQELEELQQSNSEVNKIERENLKNVDLQHLTLSAENNCLQTIKKEHDDISVQSLDQNEFVSTIVDPFQNLDPPYLEANIPESLLVPKLDQNKKKSKNVGLTKSKNSAQNKRRASVRVKKKNKKYVNINLDQNKNLDPPILEPKTLAHTRECSTNLDPPVLEPIVQLHKLDLKQNLTSSKRVVNPPKKFDPSFVSKKKKIDLDSLDPIELDIENYHASKKIDKDSLGVKCTTKDDLGNSKILYTCVVCYKTFRQKKNLLTHAIYHDNYNKYNCAVCGTSFRYKEYFRKHLEIHATLPVDCKICKQSFEDSRHLDKHYKCHKNDKKGQKSLKKINTVSSDVKMVDCNICNMSFKGKKALVVHMRTHFD